MLKWNGVGLELPGQFKSPFRGAVGYRHVADPLSKEMFSGQFSHLAGANEKDPLVFQLSKNLPRQFHSSVADGNRM